MALLIRWTALVAVVVAVGIGIGVSGSEASATQPAMREAQPAGAAEAGSMMGDVDCGGTVDALDALRILAFESAVALDGGACGLNGDVQCDSDVDVSDALVILSHSVGATSAAGDGCPAIGATIALSDDLIASALEAGDIDYEESLVYRAYAAYGDERLPSQYYSPIPDGHGATLLFKEVQDKLPTLSATTRETLAPFLARPNDPESVYYDALPDAPAADVGALGFDPVPMWRSRAVGEGKFRLWLWGDERLSIAVFNTYEPIFVQVAPEVASVLKAPLQDEAGVPTLAINPDSAIDVYFYEVSVRDPRLGTCEENPDSDARCLVMISGEVRDAPPKADPASSGYMFINWRVAKEGRYYVVAHELSHLSQNAYDNGEVYDGGWLIESTANWSAYRVLDKLGLDKSNLWGGMPEFFQRLEQTPLFDPAQRYQAWLYFYFLELETGSTDIGRKIWEAAAAPGKQLWAAVDTAYAFDEYFPKFEAYNWNYEPYDWYALDEQLLQTAPLYLRQPDEVEIYSGQGSRKFDTPGDVGWLQGHWFHFKFVNDSARSGTFYNKMQEFEFAHVTALLKVNGEWKEEDWTDREEINFCRDKSSQNYEEIVVIMSNTDWQEPLDINPDEDPYLEVGPVGCKGWSGTVTGETYLNGATFSITLNDVRFVPDPNDVDPYDNVVSLVFKSSSPIRWSASGHWPLPDCAVSGEMFLDQPGSGGPHEAAGGLQIIRNTGEYSLDISGHNGTDQLLRVACPGRAPYNTTWPVVRSIVWDGSSTPNKILDEGGKKIARGEFSNPDLFTGGHWTWDLEEVP